MRIITRSGNNNNTANGTDTFEFPFNRIRLLKKSSLGNSRSFCLPKSSSVGTCGEGIRFASFWTNPMDMADSPTGWGTNKEDLRPSFKVVTSLTKKQAGQFYNRKRFGKIKSLLDERYVMPRILRPVLQIIGALRGMCI